MTLLGEGLGDRDVQWIEWGDPMDNALATIDYGYDW